MPPPDVHVCKTCKTHVDVPPFVCPTCYPGSIPRYDTKSGASEENTGGDRTIGAMLREFQSVMGMPTWQENLRLYDRNISEEYMELADEIQVKNPDRPAVIKEACDLIYVTAALLVAMGVDPEEAVQRVHWSNLLKLDQDGKPIRDVHGKVLKGPYYKPPNMKDL